jgi:hypothetical protein
MRISLARVSLATAAAAIVATTFAGSAGAVATHGTHQATVTSGTATSYLGDAKTMSQAGISISAQSPATYKQDNATFPVTGGHFDPSNDSARGVFLSSGGLRISRGGASISLSSFSFDYNHDEGSAVVNGGSRVKLIKIQSGNGSVDRQHHLVTEGAIYSWSQAGAHRLDQALGTSYFAHHTTIGMSASKPTTNRRRSRGAGPAPGMRPGAGWCSG